ncbi:Kef-type potassium/proton antiporter (CPA2 family) [Panacagrimonas perspica]|uniref:Kef-type potassium/proton antiporter (CPA2 family) n=1 Tax=Panacagrimonas perspica TaxID=381431 RepID=A0A4S3JZ84_9GAMM|nr:cation:proton antiporter [Panacagrimonas perspica]TDU31423.1 Kef-type potassium/proton antiporter (CPA2 family) [Panacagrimonas perspica]THD00828.1 sodium:proton antiporter [Panacagrimonas perspica]
MTVEHDLPLIGTVSMGLGIAFIAGLAASRVGLPPLVGYLLAGVVVGPFTPGIVADSSIASELAEIGVILLMFGVGTHFSIRDLWAVRRIALPGAVVQIAVATGLGVLAARVWGWSIGAALVFGLALSVASTVVMLRALQERGLVDSVKGRIAVGWLVVEDLVMVLALILLPAFAGFLGGTPGHAPGVGESLAVTVALTFLKIAIFFALMYVIGLRLFPWLSAQLTRSGSAELATLFVTAVAISLAYGAAVGFGVSFALGAFLAGVVVNEAGLTHRFSSQVQVLEHVFAVLFFVSVGMLLDPAILWTEPLKVLMVLAIIMIGKTLAAMALVLLLRHPLRTALTVSASLAQIGEFSFILAGLGLSLGLLPPEGRDLILAGAILSITLNPVVFRLSDWIASRQADDVPATPVTSADSLLVETRQVVLVGYGRVGRTVGKDLAKAGIPFTVVEQNRDTVERLRKRGIHVISGDASTADLITQAPLDRTRLVVLAIPNIHEARRVFDLIKAANPTIDIVVRADDEVESEYFRDNGALEVLIAENELGHAMSRLVTRDSRVSA